MRRAGRLLRSANAVRLATQLLALCKLFMHADTRWLALALCAALPCAALDGVVTRVSDGDTLWVKADDQRRPQKLRLRGIDAPELCQAWGIDARQALSAQVLGERVQVVEGPVDDHGRRLVRLMRGDVDVGAQMVRDGHAWSYRYRNDPGPYGTEEAAARSGRRGLFADPAAVNPREFRRVHGPCPH
jgi:micrococcal nuclease